jgi:hypothetical protein
VERGFSEAGDVLAPDRMGLLPETQSALEVVTANYRRFRARVPLTGTLFPSATEMAAASAKHQKAATGERGRRDEPQGGNGRGRAEGADRAVLAQGVG